MKKDTHPQYFKKATFTCSCGTKMTTGATKEKIAVEVCSQCHPFYTGKKKVVDTTGRVDRFKKLTAKTDEKKAARKDVKSKKEKNQQRKSRKKSAGATTKKSTKKAVKKTTKKKATKKVANKK